MPKALDLKVFSFPDPGLFIDVIPTLVGKTRSAIEPCPAGLCPLRANPRREYTVNVKVGNDLQTLESSTVSTCYNLGLRLFWLPYAQKRRPT